MAVEEIVEVPEDCLKCQQKKQIATMLQALPTVGVEQSQRCSVGYIQNGLTTAILEQKGVRELLRNFHLTEVPEYYIKPESMRQQTAPPVEMTPEQTDIPVVDLASSREDVVKAIGSACEFGFFQIINHGINSNLLRKLAKESEEFFALPIEEKIRCTTAAKVTGPIHFGGGSRGDWRDVLKIHCAPPSEVAKDCWPIHPVEYRETITEYATKQQELVKRMLEIISESLGLESAHIVSQCGDPRVLLAINHYPPCPDPSLTMGIREHSDPNTISIVLQDDVSGLQVFKEGRWIDVKPLKDAFVINAGDHLQILSNGRYPSCLHRVVNNKLRSRTSIALFFSPSLSATIRPAPDLIDDEHPARFREFVYKEFLSDFYRKGGPNKRVILSQFEMQAKSATCQVN